MTVMKVLGALFVLVGSLGVICHVMARIQDGEELNVRGIAFCMAGVIAGIYGLTG